MANPVASRRPIRLTPAHKYHAVRTTVDGVTFASKREAARYQELRLLEKAGQLHDLRLQPSFDLVPWNSDHSHIVVIGRYVADFDYCVCLRTPCVRSHRVVEDVKGMKTLPLARWKMKHVKAQYGITVCEIR